METKAYRINKMLVSLIVVLFLVTATATAVSALNSQPSLKPGNYYNPDNPNYKPKPTQLTANSLTTASLMTGILEPGSGSYYNPDNPNLSPKPNW